jgi:hypothetical protein
MSVACLFLRVQTPEQAGHVYFVYIALTLWPFMRVLTHLHMLGFTRSLHS